MKNLIVVLAVMVSMIASGQDSVYVKGADVTLEIGDEYSYSSLDGGYKEFASVMSHADTILKSYGKKFSKPFDQENEFNVDLNSPLDMWNETSRGGNIYTIHLLKKYNDGFLVMFVTLDSSGYKVFVEYKK